MVVSISTMEDLFQVVQAKVLKGLLAFSLSLSLCLNHQQTLSSICSKNGSIQLLPIIYY
jgi:hypothetical protein